MTPTRFPVRSKPSFGQRLVNNDVPAKPAIPGMSGSSGTDRIPEAATTNGAVKVSPASVCKVQIAACSSNVIATTFGATSPYALAQFVTPTEGATNGLYAYYPLIMLTPHPKNGRHSQWQNIGWVRTNDQMFRNGYRTMYINSIDAAARGIADGAVVQIFNQRASTICCATVSERVMPGTLYVYEGAWYQPKTPGDPTTSDLGGNVEALIDNRFMELTGGMLANALVNVQVWNGV